MPPEPQFDPVATYHAMLTVEAYVQYLNAKDDASNAVISAGGWALVILLLWMIAAGILLRVLWRIAKAVGDWCHDVQTAIGG